MLVPISTITFDPTLYPRRRIDQSRVNIFAQAMKAGKKFPPIVLARVEGASVLLDGAHRIEAAKQIKRTALEADDRGTMSRMEAFALAVQLNAEHGKPLTKTERLTAYRKLVEAGYGIEKATDLLSVTREGVKDWERSIGKYANATQVLSGERIPAAIDRKQMLWRIRELRSLIEAELNGDKETTKRLKALREEIADMLVSHGTVFEELKRLGALIDKALETLNV